MEKNIFNISLILLMAAGCFSSCSEKGEISFDVVTGTVIGSYSNGWTELLVQVDKKYPIGKTIEYVVTLGSCMKMPSDGTYQNMIGVQPYLPLIDGSENETIINKKISFSYREMSGSEEDCLLFFCDRPGNTMCTPPNVPLYVITNYQILN